MATTTRHGMTPEAIEKQWEELEREREVLERHYQWRREVADRIKDLEARYGITSDQIHEAIDNGQLEETLEVCDWIIDYELLQRARSHDV